MSGGDQYLKFTNVDPRDQKLWYKDPLWFTKAKKKKNIFCVNRG